jgi:hypothetical protein
MVVSLPCTTPFRAIFATGFAYITERKQQLKMRSNRNFNGVNGIIFYLIGSVKVILTY